ncbi:MAG: hydrogenase expression protein HupH [Proteobacteria bacterium]|nr:hydrogenase expression protein HupH [Pseudomonadota bacterium]
MKIKVLLPVTSEELLRETEATVQQWASSSLQIDVERNEYGTASIESRYDEMLCIPDLVRNAMKAEKEGYDGVVISCMFDSGLNPCRERLSIPVVAPARASLLYASELASSFAILTPLASCVEIIRSIASDLHLTSRLACIRRLDIPVSKLSNKDALLAALTKNAVDAIRDDGAHSVILGCTGILGMAEKLREGVANAGHDVPVLDPLLISIKYLETLISLGLSHSKRSYVEMPEKDHRWGSGT